MMNRQFSDAGERSQSMSATDHRISRVEAQIEGLASNVARLETSVQKMADAVVQGSKTNWGVIFSGLGTVVVVMLLYVQPFADSIRKLRHDVDEQSREFVAHVRDGHPRRVEQKVDTLAQRVTEHINATAATSKSHRKEDEASRNTIRDRVLQVEARLQEIAERLSRSEGENGSARTARRRRRTPSSTWHTSTR